MSFYYVMKEGVSGFRRAKLAAAGSVVTIMLSLLLLGAFYVIAVNTSRIVSAVREKVEMEAFLTEPVTKQRVAEIQQQLASLAGVEQVRFVSKDDAAKVFKEEFGEDINTVLDFNPLPPSFKISLKEQYRTPAGAQDVQKKVLAVKGVNNVIYRKEMLEFIEKQAQTLYYIGLALGMLIGITAVFMVSNTIRLTIYAKRKSIQTMKLVGAARWFVRAPFVIEGMLQGLLGGVIATLILYYLLGYAAQSISSELAEFIRIDTGFYVAMIGIGILLGLFGSAISVKRFIGETVA